MYIEPKLIYVCCQIIDTLFYNTLHYIFIEPFIRSIYIWQLIVLPVMCAAKLLTLLFSTLHFIFIDPYILSIYICQLMKWAERSVVSSSSFFFYLYHTITFDLYLYMPANDNELNRVFPLFLMFLPTKWPEALGFRVVRPSISCLFSRFLKNQSTDQFQTWYQCTYWCDNDPSRY